MAAIYVDSKCPGCKANAKTKVERPGRNSPYSTYFNCYVCEALIKLTVSMHPDGDKLNCKTSVIRTSVLLEALRAEEAATLEAQSLEESEPPTTPSEQPHAE